MVATSSAVAGLHLELIPGGLAQLAEEELSGGVGLKTLPSPRAFGPEVQHEISDGAAAAGPALQVEPCVGGVDVGEQWLLLVKHGFCGEEEQKDSDKTYTEKSGTPFFLIHFLKHQLNIAKLLNLLLHN